MMASLQATSGLDTLLHSSDARSVAQKGSIRRLLDTHEWGWMKGGHVLSCLPSSEQHRTPTLLLYPQVAV